MHMGLGGRGHRGVRGGGDGGGQKQERWGGTCQGSAEGPVSGRACWGERRGRLGHPSSLGVPTVPRAVAAGTRGPRGPLGVVLGTGACAHPTLLVHCLQGSARALSSGASHPAPSPWVELGSTQAVVWCGVVWCGVVWCGVVWCGVVCCAVFACRTSWSPPLYRWPEVRNRLLMGHRPPMVCAQGDARRPTRQTVMQQFVR